MVIELTLSHITIWKKKSVIYQPIFNYLENWIYLKYNVYVSKSIGISFI